MDIKKILAGSKFVIFMLILAVIVGILSYRDSKVDIKTIKKVDVKTSSDQEDIQTKMEQISFYFYNPATNVIEQTTNGIESKRTIVEGDYVEQIILKLQQDMIYLGRWEHFRHMHLGTGILLKLL